MSPISQDDAKRARQIANLRRGGSPAPAGNQRAKRHGGFAEVIAERLDAKQAQLVTALAADAPLRAADDGLPRHDAVAVAMLAKALCRLEDVEAFLTLRGLVDDNGDERPAVERERRLRVEVADWLDALGMTPRSRAKLGLDVARTMGLDLAKQWAEDLDDEPVVEGTAHDA